MLSDLVYRYQCCGLVVPYPPTPNHDEAYGEDQDIRHLLPGHECPRTKLETFYKLTGGNLAAYVGGVLFGIVPDLSNKETE